MNACVCNEYVGTIFSPELDAAVTGSMVGHAGNGTESSSSSREYVVAWSFLMHEGCSLGLPISVMGHARQRLKGHRQWRQGGRQSGFFSSCMLNHISSYQFEIKKLTKVLSERKTPLPSHLHMHLRKS